MGCPVQIWLAMHKILLALLENLMLLLAQIYIFSEIVIIANLMFSNS